MDEFFSKRRCDRCGGPLDAGRTMSRFNRDVLCIDCSEAEKRHPDYKAAADAELAALRRGDTNFPGIGYPGPKAPKK